MLKKGLSPTLPPFLKNWRKIRHCNSRFIRVLIRFPVEKFFTVPLPSSTSEANQRTKELLINWVGTDYSIFYSVYSQRDSSNSGRYQRICNLSSLSLNRYQIHTSADFCIRINTPRFFYIGFVEHFNSTTPVQNAQSGPSTQNKLQNAIKQTVPSNAFQVKIPTLSFDSHKTMHQ